MNIIKATLCCWIVAVAAAWSEPAGSGPDVDYTRYKFGDTQVVLDRYTSPHLTLPEYHLRIYRHGELLAHHRDVGFERIFTDRLKMYFLGVSNQSQIKQAFVLFDRNGHILKIQPHDPKVVRYCELPSLQTRFWYDAGNPDPQFFVYDGKLREVRIRDCDGRWLSIYGPVVP